MARGGEEAERLLAAFGAVNHESESDWKKTYRESVPFSPTSLRPCHGVSLGHHSRAGELSLCWMRLLL
jgi:hypothetical protein